MVFVKYRQIKRDLSKRDKIRRLNWFLAVVKSKKFGSIWLRKTREKMAKRKEQEEELRRNIGTP